MPNLNWVPGVSGNPKGKTKGSLNKYTKLKEDMLLVYDGLGGWKAMLKWAKISNHNKEVFYKEMFRLMPRSLDLGLPDKGSIKFEMILGEDEAGDNKI